MVVPDYRLETETSAGSFKDSILGELTIPSLVNTVSISRTCTPISIALEKAYSVDSGRYPVWIRQLGFETCGCS